MKVAKTMAMACLGLAVLPAAVTLDEAVNARVSVSWPQVEGKVVGAETTNHGQTPVIAYTYEHRGKTYASSRLRYLWPIRDEGLAAEVLRRYPVGAAVKVHLHPRRAADSVLEPGGTWPQVLGYGVLGVALGSVFVLLSALLWRDYVRCRDAAASEGAAAHGP